MKKIKTELMKTNPKITAKSNITIPKYWAVNKKSDTEAELMMYGEIEDSDFWGDENSVTPKMIENDLKALGGGIKKLHIRLNSPGGSVYAGIAIRAILKNHSAKKILHIEGLAASIATVIMTGADEIIAEQGSMVMIHKSKVGALFSNADELRARAEQLDKIDGTMAAFYAEKTGKSEDEILALLAQGDVWFTDREALEFGLIDKINGESGKIAAFMKNDAVAVINNVEMDFSRFANAPVLPVAQVTEEPEEEPETPKEPEQPEQTNDEGEKEIMNIEQLKEQHPDLYAQVVALGADKERNRVVALNKIGADFPGAESIIAKAIEKNEGESWAYKEIAMMQRAAVTTASATIQEDVTKSGVNTVAAEGAENLTAKTAVASIQDEKDKLASKEFSNGVKGYLAKLQK